MIMAVVLVSKTNVPATVNAFVDVSMVNAIPKVFWIVIRKMELNIAPVVGDHPVPRPVGERLLVRLGHPVHPVHLVHLHPVRRLRVVHHPVLPVLPVLQVRLAHPHQVPRPGGDVKLV